MRLLHPRKAFSNGRRKRGGLLRRHVDVQRHVLRGGRKPAVAVIKLLEIMDALGIEAEQLDRNRYTISKSIKPTDPAKFRALENEKLEQQA